LVGIGLLNGLNRLQNRTLVFGYLGMAHVAEFTHEEGRCHAPISYPLFGDAMVQTRNTTVCAATATARPQSKRAGLGRTLPKPGLKFADRALLCLSVDGCPFEQGHVVLAQYQPALSACSQ
jgi:hypothetical protein